MIGDEPQAFELPCSRCGYWDHHAMPQCSGCGHVDPFVGPWGSDLYANAFPLLVPGVIRESPDGRSILVGAGAAGPAAALFDAHDLALRATARVGVAKVNDACFSPDGRLVFLAHGAFDGGFYWEGTVSSGTCRGVRRGTCSIRCPRRYAAGSIGTAMH